jgi:hypothetical protein
MRALACARAALRCAALRRPSSLATLRGSRGAAPPAAPPRGCGTRARVQSHALRCAPTLTRRFSPHFPRAPPSSLTRALAACAPAAMAAPPCGGAGSAAADTMEENDTLAVASASALGADELRCVFAALLAAAATTAGATAAAAKDLGRCVRLRLPPTRSGRSFRRVSCLALTARLTVHARAAAACAWPRSGATRCATRPGARAPQRSAQARDTLGHTLSCC